MNHINVSLGIERPLRETHERLACFFRQYAPQAEMTFALRAPFDISALHLGVTLQREVTARFAPLGDGGAYAVAWEPTADGPFPAFAGTIFVTPSEMDERETLVTLDGHYHPPLGVAGDVFDALLGKHIAQSSATDLLGRIASYVADAPAPAQTLTFA